MQTASLRVTPKDAHYRIEEPLSGLCVRLQSVPAAADVAPRIVPRLTPPGIATWFLTYAQAAEAFGRYVQGQALEIVRSDA